MPRFYFDVQGLHGLAVDTVGGEFADADAAGRDALELLPELLRGERLRTQGCLLDVTLRDETGRAVLIATLTLSSHVPAADTPTPPLHAPALADGAPPDQRALAEPDRIAAQHRSLAEACRETALLLNTTKRLLGRITAS